ncbi:alpha/beta hydrolase [Thioclava nitratireducens]|uniref:Palmitoyl-protein thioesterase ABHD10, mitochondrial n=1 Tax=Thioclava nitratireducens TaxID=1915078 RepID=A0ABM6IIV4_9RHOB|nr:alpha/beta hydrolase [Thioclava nitratireducens]AQS48689.1 alpha/beta hydrolase [Thioclava nitratireducens]WGT49698.1 alpha/beta hydrolase [Thioclava nitratireducens]
MTEYFETQEGRRIAYNLTPGKGPGVVFLGGFKSDMEGTKALALEDWAKREGRAFLRFDYSGHGVSDGAFEDGAIGDWFEDARDVIMAKTEGPQILVGSSMGGWISLLMSREHPEKVAGLVTIAAAPDFTEDGYWASFDKETRHKLESEGSIAVPSDYGEPYIITRRLINEGRERLVLRSPLALPFPTRFLQGTADEAVSTETAIRLLEHAEGADMRLTLVKGADHRFSDPDCLALIETALAEVLARL